MYKNRSKVAALATGLLMATSVLSLAPMAHASSLTTTQVQSILSLLSLFGVDSTTITNVRVALTGSAVTTTSTSCSLTRNLALKSTGTDVTCLQQFLIASGYSLPAGATGYFGAQTMAAVTAFQKAHGIAQVGTVGPLTRAEINKGVTLAVTPTPIVTPTPAPTPNFSGGGSTAPTPTPNFSGGGGGGSSGGGGSIAPTPTPSPTPTPTPAPTATTRL